MLNAGDNLAIHTAHAARALLLNLHKHGSFQTIKSIDVKARDLKRVEEKISLVA